jgi:ubiquitin-like-conjugating enzyme ATG10
MPIGHSEVRLSWDEFRSAAIDFLAASNSLSDGWTSKGDFTQIGGAYLSKTVRRQSHPPEEASCPELEDTSLETEAASTELSAAPHLVTIEYHLMYSLSYEVPVLYFNAWRSNGTLLDIEQVWDLADGAHRGALRDSKWNAVSQQDHPLLGTPFFYFHPCNSAELLGVLTSVGEGANKILSWLSAVGPLLGLNIPLEYVKLLAVD